MKLNSLNKLSGWQRVWVIATALWAIFLFVIVGNEVEDWGLNGQDAVLAGVLLLVPPALFYVAGLAVAWVIWGFRE